MELVAIVIVLALMEFFVFGLLVGRARGTYGVKAPAMSGHEVFDRYFRVHYNTMEVLIIFVPAIWLFGLYLDPRWAAGLGAIYLVGRIVYFRDYVADPAGRGKGFGMSMLPVLTLLIGALIGAGRALI
jgi:glutathione S-transferase